MIKLKLSCRTDDRYSIKINKKKISLTKNKSQIYQSYDFIRNLNNELTYKIIIKRTFFVSLRNCIFNVLNAISYGDRNHYTKVSNTMKLTIINDIDISDGEIHIIVNIINDIIINKVILCGSVFEE